MAFAVDLLTKSSATVCNSCMTSPVVWGPSEDNSRLEVQLHWSLIQMKKHRHRRRSLVVTLTMLLWLINCHFTIIIIIS